MLEEVGDFLWYFVRLAAVVAPGLIDELEGDAGAAIRRRAVPSSRRSSTSVHP